MNWCRRLLLLVSWVALSSSLCGCGSSSGSSWGETGGYAYQRDEGAPYRYCTQCLTRNDRVYLLLASARGTGRDCKGGEGKYQGEFSYMDGAKIAWSCTTPDARSGKVTIDGQEFDLAAGAAFLVSQKDKGVQVQQLAMNPAQLQTCAKAKALLGVMKANPRMASFLKLCQVNEGE